MPKEVHNKQLILDAYNDRHNNKLTIEKIGKLFAVSPKTVTNYNHRPSSFFNSTSIKRKTFMDSLPDGVVQHIIDKSINNPYFNAGLLCNEVNKLFDISLTNRKIYSILKKNNITYKKATIVRKSKLSKIEIDNMIEEKIDKVSKMDDVIFTDEVHIELSDTNKYGWNVSGEKTIFEKDAPNKVLNKRFTIIASVSKSRKIAYKIYERSVNGEIFKKYMKELDKKVVCKNHFLDNARIHHYKKLKKMITRLKMKPIYGIPYTPFLNIIENFFRSFKTKLRKELLSKRTDIKKTIRKCWNSVSEEVLLNTYNHVYTRGYSKKPS